jgi:hypothetical protein
MYVESFAKGWSNRPLDRGAPDEGAFDPVAAGGAWRVHPDGAAAVRQGCPGLFATLRGRKARGPGDHQVRVHIEQLPAGAALQVGVCGAARLPGMALGWSRGSAGVDADGRLRCEGETRPRGVGRLQAGDLLTLRLRNGQLYLRRGDRGFWNGDASADPLLGYGGLPLDPDAALFPAVSADMPGVAVRADFSGWDSEGRGLDASPVRTSLAWEVDEDEVTAVHRCAEDAPATLQGARGVRRGDHEVLFRLEALPAAGAFQVGLCNARHLLDNELGWRDSAGIGLDGILRLGGRRTGHHVGPIREGDTVAVRLRCGRLFVRRGPIGLWNGDPGTDPETDRGGLPLDLDGALHPAAYAERPGTRVAADFSRWAAADTEPPGRYPFPAPPI